MDASTPPKQFVIETLLRQCRLIRRSKDPQKALAAAEIEVDLERRLEEIEKSVAHSGEAA
jgi:hypothetical protein